MSLSKVNIEEANSHIRKLHKKIYELENKIQMQGLQVEELQKTNHQLHQQLITVSRERDQETAKKEEIILDLTRQLEDSDKRVQQLLQSAEVRDNVVLDVEKKARLFYEVVEHRSSLARILEVLDELEAKEDDGVETGNKMMIGTSEQPKDNGDVNISAGVSPA